VGCSELLAYPLWLPYSEPGLHVLLAVIGGGQIGGLAGVVFADSTLAVVRVFFDFFRTRLRTSPDAEPGSPERL
jgi:predicted PurR-regulated permease PerM